MEVTLLSVLLTILCLLPATTHGASVQSFLSQCNSRIDASTSPSYNWSSPEALELSRKCLLKREPPSDACVFYTSLNRERAKEYAADQGKFTIYDVYDESLFDLSQYPAREWNAAGSLRSVFRTTSRAYAMSCVGQAGLVIPKFETPCKSSIWWTDEQDAIRQGRTKITEVVRVSFLGKVDGVLLWLVGEMEGVREWIVKGSVLESEKTLVKGKRDLDERAEGKRPFTDRGILDELGDVLDEWAVPIRNQCVF